VTGKPAIKWQLSAWPTGPKFTKVDGHTRTTRFWVRDYADKKTALRAAPHIHRRYPDAQIELMPFKFTGFFWTGGSADAEYLY
jgi:hypothetical protein